MGIVIDPRKNWAMAEKMLVGETDTRRRQILACVIKHAKAEATPDYETLMSTVSPRAHYRNYSDNAGDEHSPKGKDGVAAYYRMIVDAGLNHIEHAVERMAVGSDTLTTEGEMKMAYPGRILEEMDIQVPNPDGLYLYMTRLLLVWEFDENGLVICEDSYDGGGPKFEGIATRPVTMDQIFRYAAEKAA